MKRILSLILATAILISCLVTGTAFSANAATARYLTATDVKGMTNAYGSKWYTNGGTVTAGTDDAVKTQFVQDKVNYVDYGAETVSANYDGAYVITSKAEEVFVNNTAAPESFRYRPGTALNISNTSSVMFYAEVPKYSAQEGQGWGLGFYGITVANASGASRYLNITANLTDCLYYLPLNETVWKAATIYPAGNGVRICKTNIPSGFKGYIRIDFSKLPMKNSNGDSFTDFAQLVEMAVAYNCVSQTDPLVLGGLIYAVQSRTDGDGSILKIGTNTYSISRRAAVEGKKVLYISGNTLADKWAHSVDGVNSGVTYGATYTKDTTVHKEPGEEYIDVYPNGTGAAYTYSGSYVFAPTGDEFKNDLTAPEAFMYQPKMTVKNSNSVLVYVEVPDYAALGETWGFGLEKFVLSDGTYYASINHATDLTTGLQYIDENGNWTNATIFARAEGEKVSRTNIPSGYKGYICFDMANLNTVGSNNTGATLYGNEKTNYISLYAYSVAYNGLSTGDNFVSGGLFYTTTNTDSTVLNFGYETYADLATVACEYITVEGMSGQNWSLGNKQGINGTGVASSDASIKTNLTVDKSVYTDPGAEYVSYYINNRQNISYSGTRVITPKTADTTFINDPANVEHYVWQAKLDIEKDDTMMFYVEVPDYEASGEEWGLGFQNVWFKGESWYTNAVLQDTEDITEGFSYLSIYGKEWENGTIYAKAEGENLVKTDLPAGFKGYVRFDLSKLPIVYQNSTSLCSNFVYLYSLNIAYNAVSTNDPFVLGDLIYRTDDVDGTVLNFNGVGYESLTKDSPDHIRVLGMANQFYNLGYKQGINGTGTTDVQTAITTGNAYFVDPGAGYISNYVNSNQAIGYTGAHSFAPKTADTTFINNPANAEHYIWQAKLDATKNDSVMFYVEVPDYKKADQDWGLAFGTIATKISSNWNVTGKLNFDAGVTEGFSYLSVDGTEWQNGTIYAKAEGEYITKTDIPSGFKGYIRFDLSKLSTTYLASTNAWDEFDYIYYLQIAYNAVSANDPFVVGDLIYRTNNTNGNILNFDDKGYYPMTADTMGVTAQNLITDTANTTNVTGTNIKVGKFGSNGFYETDDIENKSFIAEMQLTKSGGLFLDDGYAGAFIPSTKQGTNVLVSSNTNWLNYVIDENLGLKLKSGVNKLMFYVELPDVRDLNFVSDTSKALALRAFKINGYDITPYGLTYQFMDIREGVWQDGTISDGTQDNGYSTGALLGLPTDGFKGYIKIDLDPVLDPDNNKKIDYVIDKIQLGINRTSWGRKLVIGGFYAVNSDSEVTTSYFIDTQTGEKATTNVVAGDFSCNEKYDATDLALAIKYLIKSDDITGAQTARASAFDNYKADFSVVSLVQLKKILLGASLDFTFSVNEALEASTSESDVLLTAQNPDRGFRYQTFLSIDMENMPEWNLTQWDAKFKAAADKTNPNAWVNPNITKLYFPLSSFAESDITELAFKNMERAFEVVRKQGRTAIVRFWYDVNFEPDEEGTLVNGPVPEDKMLAHMQQIVDNGILERNKDVLNSVEAGFLGRYGEWHTYYDNYWQYKDEDGNLLIDTIWEKEGYNEENIIRHILDMVPSEVPVLLRTSIYRDKFLASTYAEEGDAKRLGLNNDSFYGMDEGRPSSWPLTSHTSDAAISTRNAAAIAPMSGEFFWGQEFERNGYDGVTAESAILGFKYYRQNTFSIFHNSWEGTEEVAGTQWYRTDREGDMAIWARTAISEDWLKENNVFYAPGWFKDANGNTVERTQFEFVRDYLGYKLEAKNLKIEGRRARGAEVKVSLDIVNYGFSAPFNMTSELVVLDSNNKIVSRVPAGNALDWVNTDTELVTHKINATITLPNAYGKYKIALYVHNRAGTGAYLGNNIEQVNGFNILTTIGI